MAQPKRDVDLLSVRAPERHASSLQHVLDERDQMQHDSELDSLRVVERRVAELEARLFGWQLWYSLHGVRVTDGDAAQEAQELFRLAAHG